MGSPLLIACSGGPDSTALVYALNDLARTLPYPLVIGHINHKLRKNESEGDAQFVKEFARKLGLPFRLATSPIRGASGNLEEKARVQRYNALSQLAKKERCQAIFTAHTADDQVETIFFNLMRGTGPEGLAGIQPLRSRKEDNMPVARPFLTVSKKEVLGFLKERKLKYRLDSSNQNESFSRNWMRRKLFPLLENKFPGFSKRWTQTAVLVRDEQAMWTQYLVPVKKAVLRKTSTGVLLDLKKLLRYPAAVQRRLIRDIVGKDLLTFERLEGLRSWMIGPPSNGRIWQLKKGWVVERLSKSKGSPSAKIFWFKIQKGT